MYVSYPVRFIDSHGVLDGTVQSDGHHLRMHLPGALFEGNDFDSLARVREADPAGRFILNGGELCACTLELAIPVSVGIDRESVEATLEARLVLGRPRPLPRGGIDAETLTLILVVRDQRFVSGGQSGWFEDELVHIQRQLPPGWFLKMCFGCGLSDYSPCGHGLYGNLFCFRTNKEGYRAVQSKDDLFDIWETGAGSVQETHLCPDFELRKPGSGYRG